MNRRSPNRPDGKQTDGYRHEEVEGHTGERGRDYVVGKTPNFRAFPTNITFKGLLSPLLAEFYASLVDRVTMVQEITPRIHNECKRVVHDDGQKYPEQRPALRYRECGSEVLNLLRNEASPSYEDRYSADSEETTALLSGDFAQRIMQ